MEQWIGGVAEQVIGEATVPRSPSPAPGGKGVTRPAAEEQPVKPTPPAERDWEAERRSLGNRGTLERATWWERKPR